MSELNVLLPQVIAIAEAAGQAILAIYNRDVTVWSKDDASPLTEADLAAHELIVAGLERLAVQFPVLSEESAKIAWDERRKWNRYWLVDPLDGTKEFLKRNGEFTVNIALIDAGVPVLGVVHAPVLGCTWTGINGLGANKILANGESTSIAVAHHQDGKPWRVVGSRSHSSPEFDAFVAKLPGHELVSMGSSIKLCLVADGSADLYPRIGPTSEWDTAAAHAVVLAAGGEVVELDGKTLQYNQKDSLLNPHFLVRAASQP